MHFLDPELEQYIEQHTSDPSPVLEAIYRDTYARMYMPQMMVGKVLGRFLSMCSHMIKPRRILEIGTFTGYSAICLAEGLAPDGLLYTIDVNEELQAVVQQNLERAEVAHKVKYFVGDAVVIIPQIHEEFDLVFIDANKEAYSIYYDLVLPRLRKGGVILADNVLWSGKVVADDRDAETQALVAFCQKVHQDPAVEQVLLSIRDGLLIIRKL